LAFPESVVEFFEGRLGQPPGGFPEALQKKVLRGRKAITHRPGVTLPPANFDAIRGALQKNIGHKPTDQEANSHLTYPHDIAGFAELQRKLSSRLFLPTRTCFKGMQAGEEISLDNEPGKTLIIKFLTVGDTHEGGRRQVFFELNGQLRHVQVVDRKSASESAA